MAIKEKEEILRSAAFRQMVPCLQVKMCAVANCGWFVVLRFPFVALRCVFLVRALAVLGALLAVFLATAMMFGAFGAASRVPLAVAPASPFLGVTPWVDDERLGPRYLLGFTRRVLFVRSHPIKMSEIQVPV